MSSIHQYVNQQALRSCTYTMDMYKVDAILFYEERGCFHLEVNVLFDCSH